MAKALTDDELKAITDAEIRQAIGGTMGGKLSEARRRAEYYYLGLAKDDLAPPEIDGRSTFVDTTVRNQIEWMVPSLMKTFCSGDSVVEFSPTKPGEDDLAKQATDYINYLFYKKNDGYHVLQTAIRDALLQKAGIIKVWWDARIEETREEYKGLSDIDLAQLMQDDELEPVEQTSYPDEDDAKQRQQAIEQLSQQVQQNPQAAQQIQMIETQPPKMLYDVVFKRSKKAGKVCIEAVPPEEFLISRKAKNIQDAPFIGHRIARTVSDLKAMGYENVDDISSDDAQGAYSMEHVERVAWDDDMPYLNQNDVALDPSMRTVWIVECYLKADVDGDGIAEWRKVVRAGNAILENKECDGPPFVALIPVLLPHRFFGLSVADFGIEPQRLQTQMVRSILDNQFLQVNGRYFAVEGQVNLDDLLTSRPGGIVRMKAPQMAGRLDQGMGDIQGSMQMLEWMQDYTENSTGWTRRSQGTGPTSLQKQTATGMNIITNRDDMRLDLIARNFAEGGITQLFRMMLKLVCQYQQKSETISVTGNWVEMNPREWKTEFGLTINVGLGTNNRDQQAQHMMGLLSIQQQALQIGVATPENIYNAAADYARALGQKTPEKFFTDPSKQPPPPPKPDPDLLKIQANSQAKQAELQLKAQLDQQAMQGTMQLELHKQQLQAQQVQHQNEIEAQRQALSDQAEQQLEMQRMQFEQWKAQLDADTKVVVAELAAKAGLKQTAMTINAKAPEGLTEMGETGDEQPNSALQSLVDSVNSNMGALIQSNQMMLAEITKPKVRKIVRDKQGRAQGIVDA